MRGERKAVGMDEYLSARIKTLRTVPSMEQECPILLDLGELMAKALDLILAFSLSLAPPTPWTTYLSRRHQWGKLFDPSDDTMD